MWSKFVESLNAGFFQYNSFIHLARDQSRHKPRNENQLTC
jgi:hypothetical protein